MCVVCYLLEAHFIECGLLKFRNFRIAFDKYFVKIFDFMVLTFLWVLKSLKEFDFFCLMGIENPFFIVIVVLIFL